MRKRLISLLLAVAAVLSLAAPAFAAEGPEAFTESYAGEPQAETGETGGSSEEETAVPEDTLLPEGEETPEETEETPAETEQAPAETETAPVETEQAPAAPQSDPASDGDYGIATVAVPTAKETLQTAVTEAKKDKNGDYAEKYTEESRKAFEKALDDADALLTDGPEDGNDEQYDAALKALRAAKLDDNATPEEKAALDAAVKDGDAIKNDSQFEHKYTSSTKSDFSTKYQAAKDAQREYKHKDIVKKTDELKKAIADLKGTDVTAKVLSYGYIAKKEQAKSTLKNLLGKDADSLAKENTMYAVVQVPDKAADMHNYYFTATVNEKTYKVDKVDFEKSDNKSQDTETYVIVWSPGDLESVELKAGDQVTCSLNSYYGEYAEKTTTFDTEESFTITVSAYSGPRIWKSGYVLEKTEAQKLLNSVGENKSINDCSDDTFYIILDANLNTNKDTGYAFQLVTPSGKEIDDFAYYTKDGDHSILKLYWSYNCAKQAADNGGKLEQGDYTVNMYTIDDLGGGRTAWSEEPVSTAVITVPSLKVDELKASIDKATAKGSMDQYTKTSGDTLTAALKTANEQYAKAAEPQTNKGQKAVDAAKQTLDSAVEGLKKHADYSKLNELIQQAQSITGEELTEGTFADLTKEIKSAQQVVKRDLDESQQEQVKQAETKLQAAIDALKTKDADFSKLKSAIAEATQKKGELSKYTKASGDALTKALANAETVAKDENKGYKVSEYQAQINDATKKLNDAIKGLKEKANTAELEKAIKAAEDKLSKGVYTTATESAVNKALTTAKGLLDADTSKQDDIAKAVEALNKAVAALKGVPIVTGGTWVKSGNRWFYKADGKIVKGWVKDKGLRYYTDASGVMVTGWKLIDSNWYYFAPGTNGGQMLTGWQSIGGKWYYLNPADGIMVEDGWFKVGGLWYYLKPGDGQMIEGWMKLGSNWYYLKPKDGRLMSGWQYIGGEWYYLSTSNGIMLTGRQTIGGREYYFKPGDGRMLGGWQKIEGNWYYYKPGKNNGWKLTGWQYIANRWYYLDPTSGAMWEGRQVIGGREYYLKPGDGRMLTGWQSISGNWYYYKTGRNNGWKLTGWQSIGGKWYYLDPTTGAMQDGWLQQGSIWYYLIPNNGQMVTGWQKISGSWYYFNNNGVMLANTTVDGHKLDGSGKRVS